MSDSQKKSELRNTQKLIDRLISGLLLVTSLSCLNACHMSPTSIKKSFLNLDSRANHQQEPNHVWDRLNYQGQLSSFSDRDQVQHFINQYLRDTVHLSKASQLSAPYVYFIMDELSQRGMPVELALLPMVESVYKPKATSSRGASGIWQMWPATAERFGLKNDAWYDGRHDVVASTTAALNYLSFLNQHFDGDWLLSLAAYNAGEGRVKRAILRNQRAGKATDFWSLSLPKETKDFVPKFLAITHIFKTIDEYPLALSTVANKPYFYSVNVGRQMNLKHAADLAEMNLRDLRKLNPAYTKHSTHPNGPQVLLLPVENAYKFEFNLAKLSRQEGGRKHTIKSGESLSLIAKKYNSSIHAIKTANNLKDHDFIMAGQTLIIPPNLPKGVIQAASSGKGLAQELRLSS